MNLSSTAHDILLYINREATNPVHCMTGPMRLALGFGKQELQDALDELSQGDLIKRHVDEWYNLTPAGRRLIRQDQQGNLYIHIEGDVGAGTVIGIGNVNAENIAGRDVTITQPVQINNVPKASPHQLYEPEWVEVPAGSFLMGSSPAEDLQALEREFSSREVTLSAYRIGKYPITVVQFRPFVESDGYTNYKYWTEAGWRWRDKEGRKKPDLWGNRLYNHPVIGVSWYEAYAYTQWLSTQLGYKVSLPTEAEWEKAARGTDGRIYPWEGKFNKLLCNVRETGIEETTPVGQYSPDGDSPYGCADMSGNVWEWCLSQYAPYPYEDDGRNDTNGTNARVRRGGSFRYSGRDARAALRESNSPYLIYSYSGFRVADAPA